MRLSDKITHYPTPNFDERKASVEALIIHYTGTPDTQSALERYLMANAEDGAGRISPHYVISEAGEIFSLVDESKRAWHAGASRWKNWTDLNSRTIGIELINTGDKEFASAQIGALIELSQDIIKRHHIAAQHVLGHSDIAPGRKADPGWFFPWAELARAGVGFWPEQVFGEYDMEQVIAQLHAFGYRDDVDAHLLIEAFQMHFAQGEQAHAGTLSAHAKNLAMGLRV